MQLLGRAGPARRRASIDNKTVRGILRTNGKPERDHCRDITSLCPDSAARSAIVTTHQGPRDCPSIAAQYHAETSVQAPPSAS